MQRERVSWKVINNFFHKTICMAFFSDLLAGGSKLSAKKLISVAHDMHRAVDEYPEFREFLDFLFCTFFLQPFWYDDAQLHFLADTSEKKCAWLKW